MNLLEMYFDSIHFIDAVNSVASESELQEVALAAQMSVNAFMGSIGESLVSEVIADTYMLPGNEFSTELIQYFSVCAVLHSRANGKQHSVVFPYVFVTEQLSDHPFGALCRGLYRNEKATSC